MTKILLACTAALCSVFASAQTIVEIQGEVDDSPYIGQVVTTSGIVTAVGPTGFFIQDGEGPWTGLWVYENTLLPAQGDEVSVTGTVDEYFNNTELGSVTAVDVLSSGNSLPNPVVVATNEVNQEQYEAVLLRVENAVCTNPDLGFGEIELDDASGACRVDDLFYLFPAQEGAVYNVTGPTYFSFGFYKLCPQDADDVENASPLYFTESPEEFDITTTSLSINWQTNIAANAMLEYGVTPSYELGTLSDENLAVDHAIAMNGLSPATVYYVRAHSEADGESTTLFERVVCTASESSHEIKAYFTQPVDNSVATVSDAVYTASIIDTIISYISLAQNTLDITMYDLLDCDQSIFDAINARYTAGVDVRYITDELPPNVELDWLDPGITVVAGNEVGIMHDKVLVIDRDDVDNAWVVTGSTNHTWANLGWDYNNMICIQDQSLALAYTLEFNEMWGSSTMTPGIGLFGEDKADNTPHKFNLGGIDAECYFSPSDGTTNQIREVILASADNIAFNVMAFTENSLGAAILTAYNSGVDVKGIIDYVEFSGSEYDPLLAAGVNVWDYQNEDGSEWPDGPVMHSKYAIGDYWPSSDNPWVVTGSHNWTASAGSINDENTLIIYDHEVANWYFQDFWSLWTATDVTELPTSSTVSVFPNPSTGQVWVSGVDHGVLSVLDIGGRQLASQRITASQTEMDLSNFPAGVYILKIAQPNQQVRVTRVIKQ